MVVLPRQSSDALLPSTLTGNRITNEPEESYSKSQLGNDCSQINIDFTLKSTGRKQINTPNTLVPKSSKAFTLFMLSDPVIPPLRIYLEEITILL